MPATRAPTRNRRQGIRLPVSTPKATKKSPTLTTVAIGTAATPTHVANVAPRAPAPVASQDNPVVTITPAPRTSRSSRLRPRSAIGFGRSLRGTAQVRLNAFCVVPARPRHP
jgi:hypothetical protein